MTRRRVKLAFILKFAKRKATYRKRKKGLFKKMDELSTLCDVDACAITYSPFDSQPEVWPNAIGVQRVVDQFKSMSEMEQSMKMMNQESFIQKRIAKTNEQLNKQIRDNRENEMTEVMYQCLTGKLGVHNLKLSDLNYLGCLIEGKMMEINKRKDEMTMEKGTLNLVLTTDASDNIGVLAANDRNSQGE